ncbi:MAG: ClpP family protease [Bilifractor sp.]
MNIQVKSCSGITLVPLESRMLADRKIFLEGELNEAKACEFVKEVMLLNSESPEKNIDVLINTPGGEINSGMLIYDCIQGSKAPVRMFCIGKALSMGAVIFAGGMHGRYMLPHSELMLHEPLLGSPVGGSSSTVRSVSDSLLQAKERINRILVKHTGRTEKEVEEATSFDHYFSPNLSWKAFMAEMML